MDLEALKLLGTPRRSDRFPNLYAVKHDEVKMTVLDVDTGKHITVDMFESPMDAQAELETFFAENGLTDEERARVSQQRADGAARMVASEVDAEEGLFEEEE